MSLLAHVFQVREELSLKRLTWIPHCVAVLTGLARLPYSCFLAVCGKIHGNGCWDGIKKDVVENKTTWGTGQGKHVFLLFPSGEKTCGL